MRDYFGDSGTSIIKLRNFGMKINWTSSKKIECFLLWMQGQRLELEVSDRCNGDCYVVGNMTRKWARSHFVVSLQQLLLQQNLSLQKGFKIVYLMAIHITN